MATKVLKGLKGVGIVKEVALEEKTSGLTQFATSSAPAAAAIAIKVNALIATLMGEAAIDPS